MKRLATYSALLLPFAILAFWTAYPQADRSVAVPLFHFYIVTFTTFAATVLSLFVTISVGEAALPRHLLLAVAFAWMGGVFFIHGVTTPGAILLHFHPGIVWGAWLTLFGGGAIFLFSAFAPNHPKPQLLRQTAAAILLAYTTFAVLIFLAPNWFSALQRLSISPAVGDVIFVTTLGMWLASAVRHYRNYRLTRNFVDGLMAFEAGWLAAATLSMFRFTLFNLSWWLYHVLLLFGFLIAIYALWRSYEQIRAFRLMRYFGATSLIVTAALALLAAQIYTTLVFQNMRDQAERDTGFMTDQIASDFGASTPAATQDELRALADESNVPARLAALLKSHKAIQVISLYDAAGSFIVTTMPIEPGFDVEELSEAGVDLFMASALGATAFELNEPGAPPDGYVPSDEVHVLETYSPLWPAGQPQSGSPIGVVITLREMPQLTDAMVQSRAVGLLLAAVSLGGLFGVLLFIVRRADQLINSRTRELETAYTNLRRAEGLRDDLTRMIVHDLRNPLTAMTTNIDLIGRTLNNPDYTESSPRFLIGARAAGQRMTVMIDDLLNVSKFEAGELRPALAPVHLPGLLREKLESFRSLADKASIALAVNAPDELPAVSADAGLIGRVIENLLSNAIKYTVIGGHIDVSAVRNGAAVRVLICDDGQGIPAEYHDRIFDKFVQVTDATGLPLRKGTGLGLAFCRLAIEAHGGTIKVESTVGQGSQFSFSLPVV